MIPRSGLPLFKGEGEKTIGEYLLKRILGGYWDVKSIIIIKIIIIIINNCSSSSETKRTALVNSTLLVRTQLLRSKR